MILRLVHGVDGEQRNGEPSGLTAQRFEDADLAAMIGVVELNFRKGQVASFGWENDVFGQRMAEALEVSFP